MTQLKYNFDNNSIEESFPNYWKNIDEIDKKILNYINKYKYYIKLNNHNYCPNCLNELNNDYCDYCHLKYNLKANNITLYNEDNFHYYNHYFVFNVIDNKVLLYDILYEVIKTEKKLSINHVYLVNSDGLYSILEDELISYNDYFSDKVIDKKIDAFERLLCLEEQPLGISIIYPANLDDLKKTNTYKYSSIWLGKNYLKKAPNILLNSITLYPLYYKSFEYLIKYRLYNLAFNSPEYFTKSKNFLDIFGIEKSYLSFMQTINITIEELEVLKKCHLKNKKLLSFYSSSFDSLKYLKNSNLSKIMQYIISNGYNPSDYFNYIRCIIKMKIDPNNKTILFPKNLNNELNIMESKILKLKDTRINYKIKNISNLLSINNYEDDKYIIYAPSSVDSLLNEALNQSNCLRMYIEKYSNNETHLYFLRAKENPDKSLVTIEVKNNKIKQAYTKFNKEPNEEINLILKKWEKTLLPINNKKENS